MISKKSKIKKENNFQSLFVLIIIGVVFVGVMAFLIISNVHITQKRTELKSQINELQQEILLLEELKVQYKEGLIKAEELAYWEEKLREQGYKKPGEEAIVVLPSDENKNEDTGENKSFWEKLKGFFGF